MGIITVIVLANLPILLVLMNSNNSLKATIKRADDEKIFYKKRDGPVQSSGFFQCRISCKAMQRFLNEVHNCQSICKLSFHKP